MPKRMNIYRCAWVTSHNPWPKYEEFRAEDDQTAMAMCRELMIIHRKVIVRMHLKRGNDTLWDSVFGESKWTVSMQDMLEMHITELLNITGLSNKEEPSEHELQDGLTTLIALIKNEPRG